MEDIKHAVINISSSGDNTILSAPTGTSVFYAIDHINFVTNSAVTLTLKSGSTSLSGPYSLTANQGYALDGGFIAPRGLIECGANEAFVINLSGAVQVSGFIKYRIINQ